MEANTDMREEKEGEDERRKERRKSRRREKEKWQHMWYILPGGSRGRGEGGSAIRQHIQEGGGQNISSGHQN